MARWMVLCIVFFMGLNSFALSTPDEACEAEMKAQNGDNWKARYPPSVKILAIFTWIEAPDPLGYDTIRKTKARCMVYYTDDKGVLQGGVAVIDVTLFTPTRVNTRTLDCKTQGGAGNPIRLSDGAKIERVNDINDYFPGLPLSRSYSSIDGGWLFNVPKYSVDPKSMHAKISKDVPPPLFWETWVLTVLDGNQVSVNTSNSVESISKIESYSASTDYWFSGAIASIMIIQSHDGAQYLFDRDTAALTGIITNDGHKYYYHFDPVTGLLVSVNDDLGKVMQFFYKGSNVEFVVLGDGRVVHYVYDANNRMVQVGLGSNRFTAPAGFSYKKYLYEDARFPNALTGAVDEKNIRYATWAYNELGKAKESFHGNGQDRVLISYDGNVRRVTNSLGKVTQYEFVPIKNVGDRISAIRGDASQHCEADVQYQTYFSNGLLQTVAHKNGAVTLYERDYWGRITSEKQGLRWPNGIPTLLVTDLQNPANISELKTIQTCWHPTLNKISRIIEPTKIILFDYTATGQLKSQTVKPRPAGVVDCATAF